VIDYFKLHGNWTVEIIYLPIVKCNGYFYSGSVQGIFFNILRIADTYTEDENKGNIKGEQF